ncbi:hypothetical protein HF888_05565 [Bermanella marisrubri]|uniref:Tol biopolymer transport system, TolR protein n=1 Tax=Bermanella marisrubri TaxID=207949 RepID=Q1MY74_9GAMM|nr:biopolymer transporter ExbD [Bermanella marisrubri]EAT10936.1 tol biopolymer transport system, TolR protein [Oceanobacter sp. RED65] [Bermanella marisrubri]QIZ83721.1 hypothetical protein HF888_05565 [Bermanella marisrubri]
MSNLIEHEGLQPQQRNRSIGLTPLIDVVFILLMFFMLTSSFIQQDVASLPLPSTTKTNVKDSESAMLFMASSQCLHLSVNQATPMQTRYSIKDIAVQLDSMSITDNQPLLLFTGESTTLQTMLTALTELEQALIPTVFVKALKDGDIPPCEALPRM